MGFDIIVPTKPSLLSKSQVEKRNQNTAEGKPEACQPVTDPTPETIRKQENEVQ